MEEYTRRSKGTLVLVVAFLCLFTAGTAGATDGMTFPVDEAGIAAYVKVNESIDLEDILDIYMYDHIEVLNETYVIGTVQNADGVWTHLYIGADGWVIPYYLKTEPASYIVRWNKSSPYDPTPESVAAMNTLEEMISRVCAYIEVDYETIKPEIRYYDFEYPNATNMTVIVDIAQGVTSDYFKLWIPYEFIADVNESSWSHYTDRCSYLYLDGAMISNLHVHSEHINYDYSNVSFDYHHQIQVTNSFSGSGYTSGVGWVLVYTKKP